MSALLSARRQRLRWWALGLGLAIVLLGAIAEFFTPADFYPPVLYVVSLVVSASMEDAAVLWALTAITMGLTFAGGIWTRVPVAAHVYTGEVWVHRCLLGVVILGVSVVLHFRLRLLEAYRRRGDALRQALVEIEERRRDAEEASARKSRVMAALSHDVRSPANAIELVARLIERSAAGPEAPAKIVELAQRLRRSVASLGDLLTEVLDLTRFEAEASAESVFSLADAVTAACAHLEPVAEAKALDLVVDAPPGIHIRADRSKLIRAVTNLVENAIKFTDSGRIAVGLATESDGEVQIRVQDTGRGIAPEHVARIFDPYFRVDQSASRAGGYGLGLASCKRFAEAIGGRLEVESIPGRGSMFSFTLPAARVVAAVLDAAADRVS